MARPVQIDRSKALRAARDIFWRQGFTATSMSQLLKAMDIGSGSFYAAFGSKPELFAQVIDKYQTWSAAQWERIRTSRQGLDAISEFLNTTVVDVSDKNRRKGCLLVNSILEMEGVDTELHKQLVGKFNGLEHRLSVCLQEAKDSGTLREDLSVAEGVGYLMTNIYGLRVASRAGLSRAEARQRVQLLVRMISTSNTWE
ncbi:MAG: TetR/AcrR family transcriptional regulator [Kiritimatiellia bacterium]|jgi:TetR/AcrR family transcriptional repressor of nem operon|nr:TetR/AcrR family transcriptional regulator [Kiritimatiellia bacterium]